VLKYAYYQNNSCLPRIAELGSRWVFARAFELLSGLPGTQGSVPAIRFSFPPDWRYDLLVGLIDESKLATIVAGNWLWRM